MDSSLDGLREKYLSQLNPEQYFDAGLRAKPNQLRAGRRSTKFSIQQSKCYNEGQPYISSTGKLMPGKVMIVKKCNCRLRCWEKFSSNSLQNLFHEFWAMGSIQKRREFVFRYCSMALKEGKQSYFYFLPGKIAKIHSSRKTEVCRSFFTNALAVTFRFISWTLLHKESKNGTHVLSEGRGGCRRRRLSDDQFQEIISTFNGELTQPSHYGREGSSKLYFESSKSVSYFFNKYKAQRNNPLIAKVHYDTFLKTVRMTFPELSFTRKSRDKCDSCRLYVTSSMEARASFEHDYLLHLQRKDYARAAKKSDTLKAKREYESFRNDGTERNFLCLEIDYEKSLPVPCCSQAYYSVLLVYHLTLMDLGSGEVYSYIYDESQGAKSSVEVGSCLYYFLTEQIPYSIRKIHIYQDNAASQSKNRFVINSLFHALWKNKGNLETIEMRFLEKGHTDLVLDMAHSLLERAARKQNAPQIAVPNDWVKLATQVRPKQPFQVKQMVFSDFLDWRTSKAKRKLYTDSFTEFKWKEGSRWEISRHSLCQSNDFNEHQSCDAFYVDATYFNQLSRKYGPPNAYKQPLSISVSKLESLMKYLNNAKIPRIYLPFYYNLHVDGDSKIISELKKTMKNRFNNENVL